MEKEDKKIAMIENLLIEPIKMKITYEKLVELDSYLKPLGLDFGKIKIQRLKNTINTHQKIWRLEKSELLHLDITETDLICSINYESEAVEYDEELLFKCLGLLEKGHNKGVPIQIIWQALREAKSQEGLSPWDPYSESFLTAFTWSDTRGGNVWSEVLKKNYDNFFSVYPNVEEYKLKTDKKTTTNFPQKSVEPIPSLTYGWDPNPDTKNSRLLTAEELSKKWKKNLSVGIAYITDRPENNISYNITPNQREFESGSVRDSDAGKPLVADLDPYLRLRYGYHMLHNSKKYSKGNWEKGQPNQALIESFERHLAEYRQNLKTGEKPREDHLSAMLFGIKMLMLNEERGGVKENSFYDVHK